MAPVTLRSLAERSWFAPITMGMAWLALGLLAGAQQAVLAPAGHRARAGAGLLLAGAVWVPLTFVIVALARRLERRSTGWKKTLAVHLVGAAAASPVLNGVYYLLAGALGWILWQDFGAAAAESSLRWLHLNALGYGGVVLFVLSADRWADRIDSEGERALVVASGRGGVRLPLSEIEWIQADGDYARVHAGGRNWLLSERMKTLEARLDPARFVRVHRSAIVNVEAVRELRHRSHGDYEAVLAEGTVVRVSRTRRDALVARFHGRAGTA